MINKKKKVIEVFSILMLVMTLSFISAFGMNVPYLEDTPLEVSPGQTKIIEIWIGSSPAEGNLILKAELLEDAGIASFIDRDLEYAVSTGTEVPVGIKIKISGDAVIGERKVVSLKFSDITPREQAGTVGVNIYQGTKINVLVVEEVPEQDQEAEPTGMSPTTIVLLIIGIIIIIVIILFLVKKKKPSVPEKK